MTTKTKTKKTKHTGFEYNPAQVNWNAVKFPSDISGVTTNIRSTFRDAIRRCNGSDEKFKLLMDCIEILNAYGKVKLEADKIENQKRIDVAAARSEEAKCKEAFRSRIQAGPKIKVTATSTGFVELSRNGDVLAEYNTAQEANPVAAMASQMLEEGRVPTSVITIDAFGREGIGSGQTIAQIIMAMPADSEADVSAEPTAPTEGGLQGIKA